MTRLRGFAAPARQARVCGFAAPARQARVCGFAATARQGIATTAVALAGGSATVLACPVCFGAEESSLVG